MNFNFIWLEDFLALAATGNFSRAAEDRHSSQPAFSRRIRALEDWIGVPLVDRTTQPARLTDAGAWFRTVADDLVARAARLPAEAKRVSEASSATLRIASTHALSFTFLPRWLRSLEATVPVGPIELNSDVLARCEAQMDEGRVQFVLAHAHSTIQGKLDAPPYRSCVIGHDQLIAVGAPAAGRQSRQRLGRPAANDAAKERVPLLAYSEESGLGRILRAVLARRLDAIATQVVFTAHLASVLRSMALDGRGIAWLPRTLVEDDLRQGRLVPAAEAPWNVDLEIRLYRQPEAIGRAAEAFWDAVGAMKAR